MKRHSMTLAATALVALLFLVTMGAPRASADNTFISIFSVGDPALNGYPGPYGQVEITWVNSTTANVVFTSYAGFRLGGQDAANLQVNITGTSFSVGAVTESGAAGGFTPTWDSTKTCFTSNCGDQVNGFGRFNLNIKNSDGYTSSANTISFTLTNVGGTWSDAANVLIGNGDNNDAAIHAYVCGSTPCDASNNSNVTGYVTEGAVPDGGVTLMLLGGALVGLATLGRRFRV